jgi:hypothetical protein
MRWLLLVPIAWFFWQMTKDESARHPLVRKLSRKRKSIGLTSRGELEEYWCAIKHTLHLEGHLEEMIAIASSRRNPAELENLMIALDEARTRRQTLVKNVMQKERSRTGIQSDQDLLQDYWCAIKHLLTAEGHLEEMIANASRQQDVREIEMLGKNLAKVKARRINLVNSIIKFETEDSSAHCERCTADLVH